ncbi:hypothetical protein ZWY2020_005563 [Hordeum vulgare]|nr:hypothetical protein ZWY2020_005563 [Hordeum vulgare]
MCVHVEAAQRPFMGEVAQALKRLPGRRRHAHGGGGGIPVERRRRELLVEQRRRPPLRSVPWRLAGAVRAIAWTPPSRRRRAARVHGEVVRPAIWRRRQRTTIRNGDWRRATEKEESVERRRELLVETAATASPASQCLLHRRAPVRPSQWRALRRPVFVGDRRVAILAFASAARSEAVRCCWRSSRPRRLKLRPNTSTPLRWVGSRATPPNPPSAIAPRSASAPSHATIAASQPQ